MTFQTSASDRYVVSRYLVASDSKDGRFTSVQDAIDQADADGASPVNLKIVYIKEGTYTENLTFSTGVILVGAGLRAPAISGTHTFPAISPGDVLRIKNLSFTRPGGGDLIDIAAGICVFENCNFVFNNGVAIGVSGAVNKTIELHNCVFNGAANTSAFSHDGSASNFTIESEMTDYTIDSASVFSGPSGTSTVIHRSDTGRMAYAASNTTVLVTVENCNLVALTGRPIFDIVNAAATGLVTFSGNILNVNALNSPYVDKAGTDVKINLDDRVTDGVGFIRTSFATNAEYGLTYNLVNDITTPNESGMKYSGVRTGFQNADTMMPTAYLTINGAVANQTFWAFPTLDGESLSIFGNVSGRREVTPDESIGGYFRILARNEGGVLTIVATDFTNIVNDAGTPPTFAAVAVGQDVELQITQTEPAVIWSYSANFNVQRIITRF